MGIHLICDESGAKGKATNTESSVGEVGVVAGIIIEDRRRAALQAEIEHICAPHRAPCWKLHIADLPPDEQGELRDGVFSCLQNRDIICLYEAIHVQGFHDAFRRELEMAERAKACRRSPVKVSGNVHVSSLHEELFLGFFAKAIAVIEANGLQRCELAIRTDKVDSSVARAFQNAVQKLKLADRGVFDFSGWDPRTQRVVRSQVRFDAAIPPEMAVKFLRTGTVSLEQEDSNDSLTVAVDVLANSLHHHFMSRADDQRGAPLNREESVAEHRSRKLFGSLWANQDTEWCSDAIYQHPIERSRLAAAQLLPYVKSSREKRSQLRQLVRERAHDISRGPNSNPQPEEDWHQARRQLRIPNDVCL